MFALQRRAAQTFDASKELGAVPPLGYWDPFGMMAFQDKAKFERNRELELKHGRICMVATIGMVAPDIFGRFPGYLSPSAGFWRRRTWPSPQTTATPPSWARSTSSAR